MVTQSPRILFVCLGNICRSPAAEAVTQSLAPDWQLDSAGTGDWHAGEPPYGPMQAAARQRGIDMSSLRARVFTRADFDRFDLIVTMDEANLENVERLRPEGNETPVRPFVSWTTGADHVPDPYYTRDFDGCLDLIFECARGLTRDTSFQQC